MVGHNERFAKKWGRNARDTFAAICPEVFPVTLDKDHQSAIDWGTSEGGTMLSSGLGGGINGEGAGLLICDDLIKDSKNAQSEAFRDNTWDWFKSTAWSRLAPNGVCVMIGTCWHRDDHLGRMKEEFGDEVLEINLPAIAEEDDQLGREPGEALWPEQWSKEFLLNQETLLGPYFWSSLYQQRPKQHAEAEWPDKYFEDIWIEHLPDSFELSGIGVDASKGRSDRSDYSAIVFAGYQNQVLYVDADLERRPCEKIIADTYRMATRLQPEAVSFEADQFQELLVNDFERYSAERGGWPWNVEPLFTGGVNKQVRIRRIGGWLRQGRIKFVRNRSTELLIRQMEEFPLGDYDDGPDALEQVIRLLNNMAASYMRSNQETVLVP